MLAIISLDWNTTLAVIPIDVEFFFLREVKKFWPVDDSWKETVGSIFWL